MSSCRNSVTFNVNQDAATPTLADTLRAQRRRVFACTGLYAFAAIGVLAPCAALMLIRFAEWARALPAGVDPTFARLMADRPEVLAVSCVGGAFGLVLAVCGYVAWPIVMGRNNSPSKKIWLTLGGLPIALGVVGTFMMLAKAGPTSLVAAPLMLGATFALVPFIIGLMAFGLLQIALNFFGQSPQTCAADELPPEVAEYFNGFDSAAAGANLESLGDVVFVPKRTKLRRAWIASNGAFFVDATHFKMGETKIRALSVSSATEDGHHFETTNLGHPQLPPQKGRQHVAQLDGASLADLIERHIQMVGDWTEKTGSRPLVFEPKDHLAFFAYGLAAHMQQDTSELFWIGNPYRDRPLPPLPGRVWQADECSVG